jgi:hypothetical protein
MGGHVAQHRWKDTIRTGLRERVGHCGLESSGSGQGPVALVNMITNLWVP